VSRGAGALQRRILAALAALPEGEIDRGLSLSGIGARLGPGVDPSNLRRALKGLVVQGRVERADAVGGMWRLSLWPRVSAAMERQQAERAASEEGAGNPMDAGKPLGRRRVSRDPL
jgi:DNA-binding IclR family transcriptional regulator